MFIPLGSALGEGMRRISLLSLMVMVPIVLDFLRSSMSSLATSYRSTMLMSFFISSLLSVGVAIAEE